MRVPEELNPQQFSEAGQRAYQNSDFEGAARAFAQAAKAFTLGRDGQHAAEMRNNASVAWLQAGNAQAALDAVQGTREVFAGAGNLRLEGLALGNEAAALEALGRLDEAAEKYQRSADVLEQAGDKDSRVTVLKSLSALQVKRGKPFDALYSYQVGLAGVEKPSLRDRILKRLLRLRPW